ncbi:MAG: GxxExxY protein [Akkermansiaceae bacterium]|nr:GxxExxY protein [Akkermansiaceae bacterium]
MTDDEAKDLCGKIRQIAFELHRWLRNGHLESVYENGLLHRLKKQGIQTHKQLPLTVRDEDGTILGEFFADLLVDDEIIIELKACKCLVDEHVAQLLGYLRATGKRHGLLINFGAPKLEIRKYVL